jgi:hypothetical protein
MFIDSWTVGDLQERNEDMDKSPELSRRNSIAKCNKPPVFTETPDLPKTA